MFSVEIISTITQQHFAIENIILPIGISFFTFQGISYVIDVYRNAYPAQRNLAKVALYIVLFPQLIAGPIVRYTDIAAGIEHRTITLDKFCIGIERFIIGLGKKTIIANTMAVLVDSVWSQDITSSSSLILWIASIAYTLQIYFDFSGYSDMAIGLGHMLGFSFPENFNRPYTSANITEFWRRWHISLSSWFRDYVYIPLGGNRKHVYMNLAIVFLLTGVWHGASWNFIFWGLWNAFFILLERYIKSHKKENLDNKESRIKRFASKTYALFVVNIGWIIFRGEHMSSILKYLGIMFGLISPQNMLYKAAWYLDRWTITIMVLAVFFASSLPSKAYNLLDNKLSEHTIVILKYFVLIIILLLSILRIVSGTYNPFIYFQF